MMRRSLPWLLAGGVAASVLGGAAAQAADVEVRIVNLTRGQVFSPVIAWTHARRFEPFFAFGGEASEELRSIAEDGDPGPMEMLLMDDPEVRSIAIADGPLMPGDTLTLTVDAGRGGRFLSLASMLVNTNDTFFALRGVRIPLSGGAFYFQPGWDAGTEVNNEACTHVPGPACPMDSGNIAEDGDGEGFIFTQEGIHGIGDLIPDQHDWRNPVAYIVVGPPADDG